MNEFVGECDQKFYHILCILTGQGGCSTPSCLAQFNTKRWVVHILLLSFQHCQWWRGEIPLVVLFYSFFGDNEGNLPCNILFPTMGDSSLVLVTGLQTHVGKQAPTVLIGFIFWWWRGESPLVVLLLFIHTNSRPFVIHSSTLVREDSPCNVVDNYIWYIMVFCMQSRSSSSSQA